VGGFYLYGMFRMKYKKWKTWSKASVPVLARVYLPVSHKEIQCFERKWQTGVEWPADGEEVKFPADHPVVKKFGTDIKVRYLEKCSIGRQEMRKQFQVCSYS